MNLSNTHRARMVLALAFCAAAGGCDKPPAEAESRPEAPPPVDADPELEAARVLLRHQKSRIDGVMPPASWPAASTVRRLGGSSWAVDIDTSQLPGGYPEQLVVEVSATGGHTGQPKR